LKPTRHKPENSTNSFSLTLTQLVLSISKTKKERFFIQSSGYSRFSWQSHGESSYVHKKVPNQVSTRMIQLRWLQNGMATEALTIASLFHLIKELLINSIYLKLLLQVLVICWIQIWIITANCISRISIIPKAYRIIQSFQWKKISFSVASEIPWVSSWNFKYDRFHPEDAIISIVQ